MSGGAPKPAPLETIQLTEDGLTSEQGALLPNATIGMIGGGQLGRMLASSAARLGYRVVVLEPSTGCPAAQLANEHLAAPYDDPEALDRLADLCDVVTYEFENVPLSAARYLEAKVPLFPPSRALEVSQDRLTEKTFLRENGIEVAPFEPVENASDIRAALKAFDGGVLKTRRFGYDGKGQHVFDAADGDVEAALTQIGTGPYVLEKKVAFSSEFSVIAARDRKGNVRSFDPATNEHEGGILRRSTVPAQLSDEQADEAGRIATRILDALDYVGVLGVEFFQAGDRLLVNEIAPRVHNSGHWTHEACETSQFEQHIRAICGLPLGSVSRHHDCSMSNLLGHEADTIADLLDDPSVQVTLYGKAEARAGRKMGHYVQLLALAR